MNLIDEMAHEAIEDKYFLDLLERTEKIYWQRILQVSDWSALTLSAAQLDDILAFADILSLSSDASHRNIALKIISCLHSTYVDNPKYQYYSKGLMLRLGNFPGYTLLTRDSNNDSEESLDLAIEKEFKQIINRDEYSNKVFTDSQHAVFQALLDRNHFSFSGPTSFGKSFILTSFIKSILINNKRGTNIVFLVPTRALVSQTLKKFKDILSDMEDYAISASPDIPALLRNQKKHYIFIFTPERFLHYLSTPSNPSIEYVFVDEAQKIVSEDTRSVIYYHAISLAERNSCKLFFASPNIANTDIFLKLFNKSTKETMVITEAPVCQMRLFIDLISHTATIFSDSANSETIYIDNQLDLYSMIDSISKKVDPLRYKSLVYCNTIDDTIRCAKEMADTLNEIDSPELKKASDEIAAFIHKDYYLVSLIRKGVGFHFGKLPQKVRDIVEQLYEKGDLHYLFCTSTLLEGVNLPAQNIFILNNQVGNRDFRAIDFWNLAGRAGRLAQELCGNVICVRWSTKNGRWTTDSSLDIVRSKKVEQIETDIISGRHNFYQNLLNAAKDEPFTRRDTPDEQQRIFKSYSNVLLSHFADDRSSLLRNEFQRKKPQGVIEILNYEKNLEVPADIISRFPGIKVSYQDQLWKANPRKLKKMDIPTYDSCLALLECLCDVYHWETEETGGRHPLLPHGNRNCLRHYASLMSDWMNSKSINEIIAANIRSHKGKRIPNGYTSNNTRNYEMFNPGSKVHLNIIINETISDIDTFIRFSLKTYFENYYCILERRFGKENAGRNWAIYMEHGTCKKALIEIQKLGIPRHLSNVLLSDFKECCKFDSSGELVELYVPAILQKIHKQGHEKYAELVQSMVDNYLVDVDNYQVLQ